jgi:hypothetical protein
MRLYTGNRRGANEHRGLFQNLNRQCDQIIKKRHISTAPRFETFHEIIYGKPLRRKRAPRPFSRKRQKPPAVLPNPFKSTAPSSETFHEIIYGKPLRRKRAPRPFSRKHQKPPAVPPNPPNQYCPTIRNFS